jgi:hypothetical protein
MRHESRSYTARDERTDAIFRNAPAIVLFNTLSKGFHRAVKTRQQTRDSRLNCALPGCRASARLRKRTFSSFPTRMTRMIEGPDKMHRNADCPNHAAVERALVAARSSIDCPSVARYSIARSSMARSSTAWSSTVMAMVVVDPQTCFRSVRLRLNNVPIPLPRHSVAAMSYARSRP